MYYKRFKEKRVHHHMFLDSNDKHITMFVISIVGWLDSKSVFEILMDDVNAFMEDHAGEAMQHFIGPESIKEIPIEGVEGNRSYLKEKELFRL